MTTRAVPPKPTAGRARGGKVTSSASINGGRLFTPKQGQYLAFIYYYTKIHGMPPAEADFRRFFRVTPPAVHEMIKTLHTRGFIEREPGRARSIRLHLARGSIARLGMNVSRRDDNGVALICGGPGYG